MIQTAEEQQDLIQTEEDEWSDGTNNTWTPSIDGEDSDDEVDLEDNAGIWQEVVLQFDDFSISFNNGIWLQGGGEGVEEEGTSRV